MMTFKENPSLDDVLNEFVAENEVPTAEDLTLWTKRYPQYSRELVGFSIAWVEELILPPAPELGKEKEEALIERAMSHMLNVAYNREGRRSDEAPNNKDEISIDSLTAEARRRGLKPQEFANLCRLNLALVAQLNSRLVQPDSIPPCLIDEIASRLKQSTKAIMEYLSQPPQHSASQAFLSYTKPREIGQKDFYQLVLSSSLSEENKAYWVNQTTQAN